jgi:hypothetical protein
VQCESSGQGQHHIATDIRSMFRTVPPYLVTASQYPIADVHHSLAATVVITRIS